jgi:hypothetical protein
MTKSEKKKTLTANACLWVAAIALPVICYLGFAATKFPWPILIPLLLIWPAIASNQMLSNAIGKPTDDPGESNARDSV